VIARIKEEVLECAGHLAWPPELRPRGRARHLLIAFDAPSVKPLTLLRSILHIAADVISAVEFDSDGSYLATGDKGGRVVLFEKVPMQQVGSGWVSAGRRFHRPFVA